MYKGKRVLPKEKRTKSSKDIRRILFTESVRWVVRKAIENLFG